MNKILVLSPHPDDGLLGCGGTISRFIEEGKEVWYVIFSESKQGFSPEEIENSILALGIKRDHIISYNFPVRKFNECRQEILQFLVDLRAKIAPDLVLCHSSADTHQDHEIVRREAFRAFKQHSIWGYDLPWNTRNFKSDIFVPLEERNVETKTKALDFITSQKDRKYYNSIKRMATSVSTGEKIGKDYAEAFESISQIL